MRKFLLWLSMILILGVFGWQIIKKESLLSNGSIIILELAPVDPRSLMQGDYMRLRYQLSNEIEQELKGKIVPLGKVVLNLNTNKIAILSHIYSKNTALKNNEQLLIFRKPTKYRSVHITTDAWFFQEGKGEKYTQAKYGKFRVDKQGNALLVKLLDENLKVIE